MFVNIFLGAHSLRKIYSCTGIEKYKNNMRPCSLSCTHFQVNMCESDVDVIILNYEVWRWNQTGKTCYSRHHLPLARAPCESFLIIYSQRVLHSPLLTIPDSSQLTKSKDQGSESSSYVLHRFWQSHDRSSSPSWLCQHASAFSP